MKKPLEWPLCSSSLLELVLCAVALAFTGGCVSFNTQVSGRAWDQRAADEQLLRDNANETSIFGGN